MGLFKTLSKLFLHFALIFISAMYFLLIMLFLTLRYGPFAWFKRSKRSERPACMENPELGTHGFVKTKDVELHYVAAGDRDKPLMLFLHGFPECWYSWRHQLIEFKKDYRVLALDMRGYCESQKPKGKDSYLITKVAGDVKDVISQLGYSSCTLVAHDWGGVVAYYFAGEYPDLVDKLIIMNSPHPIRYRQEMETSIQHVFKSLYVYFYQLPWLPEWLLGFNDLFAMDMAFYKEGDSNLTKENSEAFKYAFSQPGALASSINYYRANIGFLIDAQSTVRMHDNIPSPTLIVWGKDDKVLRSDLVIGTENFVTDLKVSWISGAGHFVQQEKPDDVNKAMRDFLQGGAHEKQPPMMID